ncbi:MAG: hypothetical protein DRH70_07935 [Candidatus Coatesbacteria bacterium]|nr:MAG: hypothetical protein DRH70_07935 [Candidatus Coatesbacteria bacterium]
MRLSETEQQALNDLVEKLKSDPLSNPILLADLTQLRSSCDIFVSLGKHGRLRGVLAVTHHLPLTTIAFSDMPAGTFIDLMTNALDLPQSESGSFYCLASHSQRELIKSVSYVKWEVPEFRYELGPEASHANFESQLAEGLEVRELSTGDVAAISALYSEVPLVAFSPKVLTLGPWVGVFSGESLVGVAGVHFSTPWVTELGHAVTHTNYRRMGCARALLAQQISLLTNKTQHITACCLQENYGPQALLESIGFKRLEQVWLMEFGVG